MSVHITIVGSMKKCEKLGNTQNNNMFFCKKLSNPISPCPQVGFNGTKTTLAVVMCT
jgi:hypothetical protein